VTKKVERGLNAEDKQTSGSIRHNRRRGALPFESIVGARIKMTTSRVVCQARRDCIAYRTFYSLASCNGTCTTSPK
jgi:hypothetical protein